MDPAPPAAAPARPGRGDDEAETESLTHAAGEGAGAGGSGAPSPAVAMRAPLMSTRWLAAVAAFAVLTLVGIVVTISSERASRLLLVGLVGTIACLVAGIATRPRTPLPIRFDEEGAVMPRPPQPDALLRYTDLVGVHLVRWGWRSHVVLARGSGWVVGAIPYLYFAGRGTPERFVAALRERIGALPDGAARLREIERRDAAYFRRDRARPGVVVVVCVALTAVYAVEAALGAAMNLPLLAALGAITPTWSEGGWHRLVSANLLHLNAGHLAGNVLLFVYLRGQIERWLDVWRVWIVVASSALAGMAAAAVLPPDAVTVGASAAVSGILGAVLALALGRRRELADAFAMPRFVAARTLLLMGVSTVVEPMMGTRTDHGAHAIGALAGALVFAWLARGRSLPELGTHPGRGVRGAAIVLALVFAAAIVLSVLEAWREVPAVLAIQRAQG